jgi:hypothetical protein
VLAGVKWGPFWATRARIISSWLMKVERYSPSNADFVRLNNGAPLIEAPTRFRYTRIRSGSLKEWICGFSAYPG